MDREQRTDNSGQRAEDREQMTKTETELKTETETQSAVQDSKAGIRISSEFDFGLLSRYLANEGTGNC